MNWVVLRTQGVEIAFIVDDNLIGNKREIKHVLRDWPPGSSSTAFHSLFFTEASLDLAEDAELMQLMVDANVNAVFIGIESTSEESLRETKKFQNVRPCGTLVERVHAIQNAGLEVWSGMILGFDHDDSSVFAAQVDFLRQRVFSTPWLACCRPFPRRRCMPDWRPRGGWTKATIRSSAPT